MNFAEVMREESQWTKTENGADCKNTTGSAMLDMFATIGAMRNRTDDEVIKKFELAFQEDALHAMKCMFYARDVRGGLGERKVFRTLLKYAANKHTEELRKNIFLIAMYGRWDDYFELIGTSLEEDMWEYLKNVLADDLFRCENKKPCSLLAKWLKSESSNNKEFRNLARHTASKLGMTIPEYRRLCSKLRKYIDVTEVKMSSRDWGEINYPNVPSRAMMIYRNAFEKHDFERFKEYIQSVQSGEAKINSSTLYPYDIVEKILYGGEDSKVLEAQWNALPNYVEEGTNAVVIADVSGSMRGRPLATSIGLAMYFAERNKGAYHNLFMTFSSEPEFVELKGKTITEKVNFISKAEWGISTNLEKALLTILAVGIESKCTQEEMPKSLIIISDMQINSCTYQEHREQFYDYVARIYEENGYSVPNIVFWNVRSPKDTFLADKNRKGVQLVSGQSASTFKNIVGCANMTPMEMMYSVLDSDRYSSIII